MPNIFTDFWNDTFKGFGKIPGKRGKIVAQEADNPPRREAPLVRPLNEGALYAQTVSAGEGGGGKVAKQRHYPPHLIEDVAFSDPVTWGLIRMTRSLISQTPWEIVPDVDPQLQELDRWYDQSCDSINEWGYATEFDTELLSAKMRGEIAAEVSVILADKSTDNRATRYRLETLFRVAKREVEQEAIVNARKVKTIFERPNTHREKSFRSLIDLVLKDLLIHDAGVFVKGYNALGNLAEIYTLPGAEIVPLAYGDGTVPQPPLAAYLWEKSGKIEGYYANSELTYIMENPTGNGLGMSPVEALVQIITATLLGDSTFMRNLKEGSIPPGILNLKDAREDQRRAFEAALSQQMQKAGGNKVLVVSGVPSEDGEFQWLEFPRGVDFQKAQVLEYMKMAPGIKAFAFGYEQKDIGLITDNMQGGATDTEVGAALMERRAITSRLNLLAEYLNAEIVKQEWDFKNVKFVFRPEKSRIVNPLQLAQSHSVRIANGSLTRNESRLEYSLRPIPGGDVATITTGNALVQADVLEPADGEDPKDVVSGDTPGNETDVAAGARGSNTDVETVEPAVTTTPKKRNNANKRDQLQGARTTK